MVIGQMDAGKALAAAAAKGRTTEVQRILEECRVPPDTLNEFGKTALQVRTGSHLGHVRTVAKHVAPHASSVPHGLASTNMPVLYFPLHVVQCALRSLKKKKTTTRCSSFPPEIFISYKVQKNTTVKTISKSQPPV